jgi:hypothetical protein
MASEDQEILAKISQLAGLSFRHFVCGQKAHAPAGQINRHKNRTEHPNTYAGVQKQSRPYASASNRMGPTSKGVNHARQTDLPEDYPHQPWRPTRGGYSARGRGRGGASQIHRHKTLVLNNSAASAESTTPTSEQGATSASHSGQNTPQPPTWVTKTDRHLQLINPAIYEREAQTRAKAMEETRKLKLKQKDEREKLRFTKHLERLQYADPTSQKHGHAPAPIHEILIQGIKFRVTNNGSKLVKTPGEDLFTLLCSRRDAISNKPGSQCTGDENAAKATPKMATVGGVRFYRSKNGNMYRSGIVKAQRYAIPDTIDHLGRPGPERLIKKCARKHMVKKIDEPCKIFSTTGTFSLSQLTKRLLLANAQE